MGFGWNVAQGDLGDESRSRIHVAGSLPHGVRRRGEENVVNLSGLTAKTTIITPAALSDDTCQDGICFGDRWRMRASSTVGTYAGNTSLSLRMNAR
jgi:hypothetical protein